MRKLSWRKCLALLRPLSSVYAAPQKMPHTSRFWLAMALVGAMTATFALFFIAYLTRMQDALLAPAEDVGIMNQALWSLVHGHLLHQTICDSISDNNCYSVQGFSRFAIHFEPILFPLALVYTFWPGSTTLIIVQTLVVASGAFPAFWLARLRVRSDLAGVAVAALYLLYPSLQQAEVAYFHAVTLTAALLLLLLYFMYTRQSIAMFLCALLTIACKEELAVTLILLGLWSLVFQPGWRSGWGLVGLGVIWLGLEAIMFHIFSPVGHPLLVSRYTYLGRGPLEILLSIVLHPIHIFRDHVLEHDHFFYVRLLLSSVSYLALLAPWILVLALPALAVNLLSSDPNQYQGLYQYNAEIIPIVVVATIEALVVILSVVQWTSRRWATRRDKRAFSERNARQGPSRVCARGFALYAALSVMVLGVLYHAQAYGVLPFARTYVWPPVTTHDAIAQRLIRMIPATASVSAQSDLVPALSQRQDIYLYPYGVDWASYILLDVTSDTYPYTQFSYDNAVKQLLLHGNYGLIAADNGYLLLKRGLPAPGPAATSPVLRGPAAQPNLPKTFCSFIQAPPHWVATHAQVTFRVPGVGHGEVRLVGFQVRTPGAFLQVITYWGVQSPMLMPLYIRTALLNNAGQELFGSQNFAGATWCPTNTWQPGEIVQMSTSLMYIGNVRKGQARMTLTLLPDSATSATMGARIKGLPFHIVQGPRTVVTVPGTNLVQLQTITLS